MRTLLLALLLALQVTQEPPEPYEGQRNHAPPPDGWYCMGQNYELTVPPAHVCACERMCDDETGQIHEDRNCTVWCHASHCHCDVSNKTACK